MADVNRKKKDTNINKIDLLACDVCLETYDENTRQSKFLSCHHSFCEPCLLQILDGRDSIECPTCRTVTDLKNGISGLQTNFYIGSIQTMLKKHGLSNSCVKHSFQPLSFFCQTCSLMICRDCTVLDHKDSDGHHIQDVDIADDTQRKELDSKVTDGREKVDNCLRHVGRLKAELRNIQVVKSRVLGNIDKAFEQFSAMLDSRRLRIHEAICSAVEENKQCVSTKMSTLSHVSENVVRVLESSSQHIHNGHLSEVISAKNSLDSVMKDLNTVAQEMEITQNKIVFDWRCGEEDFVSSLAGLGNVIQQDGLPSCFEFGGHDHLVPCLEGEIILEVFTCNRDKYDCAKDLNVIVMDSTDCTIESSLHYGSATQLYSLRFTPQMSGEYRLTPTFYGEQIVEAMHKIQVTSNNPVTKYGRRGNGEGYFHSPRALALDKSGNIYVADTGNKLIQKLNPNGEFLYQFKIDSGNEECSTCDLALTSDFKSIVCTETRVGTNVYLSEGNTVAVYTVEGGLKYKFSNKAMKCALCLATNSQNEIIISDYLVHSLFVYDDQGHLVRKVGDLDCLNHPAFICIGENDSIIVTDTNNNSVLIFNHEGKLIKRFGKLGCGKGELKQPFGVATDGELIVVVDSGNCRIQVFKMDGTFVSMIESTNELLDQPRGLVLTHDGHILVADRDNHCIKKYRYK